MGIVGVEFTLTFLSFDRKSFLSILLKGTKGTIVVISVRLEQ